MYILIYTHTLTGSPDQTSVLAPEKLSTNVKGVGEGRETEEEETPHDLATPEPILQQTTPVNI